MVVNEQIIPFFILSFRNGYTSPGAVSTPAILCEIFF